MIPLLLAVALAAAPPAPSSLGRDPERLLVVGPTIAVDLGESWVGRFDDEGIVRRAWGPGLPGWDADGLDAHTRRWVRAHADILGLSGYDLALEVGRLPDGRATVTVHPVLDGLRVWNAALELRLQHGRLTMVLNRAPGPLRRVGGPSLASAPPGTVVRREQLWVPRDDVLVRAWQVDTEGPRAERWWFASDGRLLARRARDLFFDGTVDLTHDDRASTPTVGPMRHARLDNTMSATTTGDDGTFSIPDGPAYRLSLIGPYLDIDDLVADEETAIVATDTLLTDAAFSDQARNVWAGLQHASAWGRVHAPDLDWPQTRIEATVNEPGPCNGYYDGILHFQEPDATCVGVGNSQDMILHEWAHGLQDDAAPSSILAGDSDISFLEGAADAMVILHNADPVVSPGFWLATGEPVRDAGPDLRWPDDFESRFLPHTNGLIFAGAFWDTMTELRSRMPDAAADAIATELLIGLYRLDPALEHTGDEVLFLDDDDADLSNGTPNRCALLRGFGRHGLGPASDGLATLTPTSDLSGEGPVTLGVALEWLEPGCGDASEYTGTLHWKADFGPERTTPLVVSGDRLEVVLPDVDAGTVLTWHFEVDGPVATGRPLPADHPVRRYDGVVGPVLTVACEGFDTDDGGYQHALLAGTDNPGADDWEWGAPLGRAGDPDAARGAVWGTDLGNTWGNGAYQGDKHTRLQSPVVAFGHYTGASLRFRRWLTVQDGAFDEASVWADERRLWRNAASPDPRDATDDLVDTAWTTQHLPLPDRDDVVLAWELETSTDDHFGGWNLDDVCVLVPATADNRLGVTRARATVFPSGVRLSWVQPRHGPIARVQVVRRLDRFPTHPRDGVIVHEDQHVKPGVEGATFDRGLAVGDVAYYAVYASDGADWLSWTVVDRNAVAVRFK
jgi:hypothetical protein